MIPVLLIKFHLMGVSPCTVGTHCLFHKDTHTNADDNSVKVRLLMYSIQPLGLFILCSNIHILSFCWSPNRSPQQAKYAISMAF